jgi:hypothetical protein
MHRMKCFKNGHASMERLSPSGLYLVQVYIGTELHDKIRCDTYQGALEYYRAFQSIARNA